MNLPHSFPPSISRRPTAAIAALATAITLFAFASALPAQESSSRPNNPQPESAAPLATPSEFQPATTTASVADTDPSAALRDVLEAACSQDASGFSHFLTARSKQSFDRLAPAARVSLMKRFVLLSSPGRSSATSNPAGRPIVRCATVDVTTEMSIGGADIRDNLAFLPLELRDADDSTGVSVHQVNMGLVREGGQWRLLSLGLLLLDLPSLEVEWDSAEADANEATALQNLKKLTDAVETYRRTYFSLPESLANLRPPPQRETPKSGAPKSMAATRERAGLLDDDFAAGNKDGYEFRIIIVGASALGAPAKYQLSATPSSYGRTGKRSFFRDADGGLHAADHHGAVGSESDPAVQ
jgi:hypothetical protein